MKVCFKMIKAGSGVDVWTYSLSDALRKKGINTEIHEFSHQFQYYPYFLKLLDRKTDADIIHTNSWSGFVFKDSRPMVTTEHLVVHDTSYLECKSVFQRVFHRGMVLPFEKKTFQKADTVVCVSEYSRKLVGTIFKGKTRCILNGVNHKLFQPDTQQIDPFKKFRGKKILLYAGNMTRRKGVDMFPEIMRLLGDGFVLFCATGLRGSKFSESENIQLLGKCSQGELVNLYSQCDVFLFPTRMEGLSLTVIEAMACGAPVVTTGCCSMPELVVDGKGGFLCEKNSADSFVEKVKSITADRDVTQKMRKFNRARVERCFTLDKMAEEYSAVYADLLR